ncbi:MAG: DUF6712 family protein [Janthinobacterium lividum]
MSTFFKTEAELREYLPLTAGFKLVDFQTHLLRAQTRYLREALGLAQLNDLATAYDAGSLALEQQTLLAAVRLPLASFAAAYYGPGAGVQLGATGPVQSTGNTIKPASASAVATMSTSLTDQGFEALEALLELLEDNRADYPLWANSAACTVLHGQFLATAREFDQYVFIDRSRQKFLSLQPTIRDVERLAIRPMLGTALVTELRSQLTSGTVTALNEELLSYVRPAVANLALKDDEDRQATGNAYLEELRAFLYERADDFPLFKSSTAYQPDVAVQLQQDTAWGFHAAF